MLPLVCNDAVAIFFMFDLSRKSTLLSVKEWYRQARGLNRVSFIIVRYAVGCPLCGYRLVVDCASVPRRYKVRPVYHTAT
jgi:hypothetical protein